MKTKWIIESGLQILICSLLGVMLYEGKILAQEKESIYNSSYVQLSEDGKAWTTNHMDQSYEWYDKGEIVKTGISSSLRVLNTGEHYYAKKKWGELPVGAWIVEHKYGRCIHDDYPIPGKKFHNVPFTRNPCMKPHYSGWLPICADCGELLETKLIYMSKKAAESIDYIELGTGMDYYYLCPSCRNLEQGVAMEPHLCKAISWNSYLVRYDQNTLDSCGGVMPSSMHMYQNGTEYEGEKVTPITKLYKNAYQRKGYEFVCWNTQPDGSGVRYEDEAEILNLSDKDLHQDGEKAVVTLYAQWRVSRSVLVIDPNGGEYGGKTTPLRVERGFGDVFSPNPNQLKAPGGYTISFETNGGEELKSITGTTHFVEWNMLSPFRGRITCDNQKSWRYLFCAEDGNEDTIQARYEPDVVKLPHAVRKGFSFGGWYFDKEYDNPVGDTITPCSDITLYAQWVELKLSSEENWIANQGRGALDLLWRQDDKKNKVYYIYQSKDLDHWEQINEMGDIKQEEKFQKQFLYRGQKEHYAIPHTGWYWTQIYGAQGGNYGRYRGGYGGMASAKMWFRRGEVLEISLGGCNGFGGGGKGSRYGNGGGYSALSSNQRGLLLLAGGGGGASPYGNGGMGGSSSSVTVGKNGKQGLAGGGGGFLGGTAGEELVHHHRKDTCPYHIHQGNAKVRGGCYQKVQTDVKVCTYKDLGWRTDQDCGMVHCTVCGGISQGTNHCHWYAHSVCGQEDGHWGYTTCAKGHVVQSWGAFHSGTHEYRETSYQLSCGVEEGWNCQYEEGEVISSRPAYGGSNYRNKTEAFSYEDEMGVRVGNGFAQLESKENGFVEQTFLKDIGAADERGPDKISSIKENSITSKEMEYTWECPRDLGTVYYHYVVSLYREQGKVLCQSNLVRDEMISGVQGYYVCVDEKENTIVNKKNGKFQKECVWRQQLGSRLRYMHVAAVDRAGNVGATFHQILEKEEGNLGKILTRRLMVEEGEQIHHVPETNQYYVRCDGKTPILLTFASELEGMTQDSCQVKDSIYEFSCLELGDEDIGGRFIVTTPLGEVQEGEIRNEGSELQHVMEGEQLLSSYPYSYTLKSNYGNNLLCYQKFIYHPLYASKRICVVPRAIAECQGKQMISDRNHDEKNAVILIGDDKPPMIHGMEELKEKDIIHRLDGEITLNLSADDALSGVASFYVKIENKDNHLEKTFYPGNDGKIHINITKKNAMFSGNFKVMCFAQDHVGNICDVEHEVTEFSLETEVKRVLEPHEPLFKAGESGILTFTTWGYAERVEVEFPKELMGDSTGICSIFDYTDNPELMKQEQIQFMIPLDMPRNQRYQIIVRAYKKDQHLEEYPSISVIEVEGSVLDELRTRLR